MDADKFLFAVVGWSVIGSLWAFMEEPNIALLTLALTVGTAMLLYFVPVLVRSRDRRFEIPTLLRIGPFFLAYLTLLAIWPLPKTWPDAKWTGAWGLSEIKDGPGLIAVLQLLEYVLTFTMFGYILGQLRGRARESKLRSLLVVMIICAAVSGALEVMRGYHPGHSASFLQFALCVAAGTYGGYLYQAQLATIRLILAR
jgi:VanZ family protein